MSPTKRTDRLANSYLDIQDEIKRLKQEREIILDQLEESLQGEKSFDSSNYHVTLIRVKKVRIEVDAYTRHSYTTVRVTSKKKR